MVYTKATFEMVARLLAGLADRFSAAYLASKFAYEFEQSNSRFDRSRFYRACGLQENK